MKNYCPICGSENTLEREMYSFTARPMPGHSFDIQLPSFCCHACGEQVETPELVVQNSTLISEAKLAWLASNAHLDQAIGYIVKELRSSLDLSQKEFSALIGATGNSISKYESHTIVPSALTRTFFIVLAKNKEARFSLAKSCFAPKTSERRLYPVNAKIITHASSVLSTDNLESNIVTTSTPVSIFNYFAEVFEIGFMPKSAISRNRAISRAPNVMRSDASASNTNNFLPQSVSVYSL
ncbi:YgiT-type zinc finger protein [Pseudomonas lurida]|uniref:type II TA system antitoxin MqsA family protein n=1 Tax=Pseudomonas lurida TaxID=244566 RepID=UPI00164824DE|nr:type II TA system antitoxin MqsA family protein [Pseudomonas lurida]MBC3246536.1 YgiT-type zinc finger protein [Pseudomonas lurida]